MTRSPRSYLTPWILTLQLSIHFTVISISKVNEKIFYVTVVVTNRIEMDKSEG